MSDYKKTALVLEGLWQGHLQLEGQRLEGHPRGLGNGKGNHQGRQGRWIGQALIFFVILAVRASIWTNLYDLLHTWLTFGIANVHSGGAREEIFWIFLPLTTSVWFGTFSSKFVE